MPDARYPDLGGDAVGRARTDESDTTGVGRSKVSPACLDHVLLSEAEGEPALSEIDGHTVEGKVLTCRQRRAIGHKIGSGVARIGMDEAFRGVLPFFLAQLAVLFLLVLFPDLVLVPLKWWLR